MSLVLLFPSFWETIPAFLKAILSEWFPPNQWRLSAHHCLVQVTRLRYEQNQTRFVEKVQCFTPGYVAKLASVHFGWMFPFYYIRTHHWKTNNGIRHELSMISWRWSFDKPFHLWFVCNQTTTQDRAYVDSYLGNKDDQWRKEEILCKRWISIGRVYHGPFRMPD
jgi:hypothetical protein